MRVVLRSGFDRYSGYGNDAIDLAVNLEKAGADVLPWPTGILPGLPRSFTRLLEKDPTGQKDVVLAFCPPFDLKPWEFKSLAPKVVGYSMWERTPLLPQDFNGHGWELADGGPEGEESRTRLLKGRGFDGLDHLFVTCPMNVEAFRNVDAEVPIGVVPCGIEPDDWPVARRDPQRGPLRFLMVGMLGGRKVPFVLLDAWRDLKERHPEFDATLTLHTLAPGLHPKLADVYPDVTVSSRPLDREALIRLYHDHDVLVSVSRGEGNNKPAMEFMATGGTVIASDWSGHQNWLHPDITYGVPGTLRPCRGAEEASDFHVDTEALQERLLAAWGDRADVARRGERAATWVRESLSWQVVVEKILKTLERL